MHESNHSFISFFAGTLIGGMLGALSVLLFTTKEGQRIQRAAKNKYHKLEDAAEKAAESLPKRAKPRRKPAAK